MKYTQQEYDQLMTDMNRQRLQQSLDDSHSSTEKCITVLSIDPGPKNSAFVIWDGNKIGPHAIETNEVILDNLISYPAYKQLFLVIEQIKSYGMAVSDSIFETVFWTGRFYQAWEGQCYLLPRMKVKIHLCHSSRAKDSNIRQALIDRFGEPGTKKNPGLTYGLKKDLWQAFALAVTFYDMYEAKYVEWENLTGSHKQAIN